MTKPGSFDVLNDDFWENDQHSATLHTRTVLQGIREDLSRERSAPITVDEIWEIAQKVTRYLGPGHRSRAQADQSPEGASSGADSTQLEGDG